MFVIVCGFRHEAYKPIQALPVSSGHINVASLKGRKEGKKTNERERIRRILTTIFP